MEYGGKIYLFDDLIKAFKGFNIRGKLWAIKNRYPISCYQWVDEFENTGILPIFDVFIYLESSSKWPKEQEAIECDKDSILLSILSKK